MYAQDFSWKNKCENEKSEAEISSCMELSCVDATKYFENQYDKLYEKVNSELKKAEPNSIESITLKLTGGNSFHVKDLKLDLKGFYKVKAKGNVIAVPDFKLPAETNNFVASPFECFLKKKETGIG